MSPTSSASPQTRELIDRLAEGISSAQAGHEVWFTLAGKDKAYEQYSAELQDYQYRDFFDSVLNAHLKVMFIEIACLFDSCEQSSSFYKLKKSLKDDGRDDLVDRIECELSSHRDLVKRIKGNRNKRIAHHDMTWTEERVYKEFGVSPNEVGSLLDAFNELLKAIYKAVVSPDTAYPIARPGKFEDATFRLLYVIKNGRA